VSVLDTEPSVTPIIGTSWYVGSAPSQYPGTTPKDVPVITTVEYGLISAIAMRGGHVNEFSMIVYYLIGAMFGGVMILGQP
jgi:hypothetical protein